MTCRTTHHLACDCREAMFEELQNENTTLRSEIKRIQSQQEDRLAKEEEFKRLRKENADLREYVMALEEQCDSIGLQRAQVIFGHWRMAFIRTEQPR